MKVIKWSSLIALLLLGTGLWAATEGKLRGELVSTTQVKGAELTIYLKGYDGNVREVLLSHAVVDYDEAVPAAERKKPASRALVPGTDVRVTALWDAESGEWTASLVEVIPHHAAEFEEDYGADGAGPAPVTAPSTPVVNWRKI